jgi:hypothetical protein
VRKVKILNLTQHVPSSEQSEAGVEEPESETKSRIKALLDFQSPPTREEIESRSASLAEIVSEAGAESAMIGGAPFLMSALERALKKEGVKPLYAFSRRESVEKKQEDGSVVKTTVFRHLGFVEP